MNLKKSRQFKEGEIIGCVQIIMNALTSKVKKRDVYKMLKDLTDDGTFTKFQRQQALFFLRMGMQQDKKRRRKKKEYSEKEKIII